MFCVLSGLACVLDWFVWNHIFDWIIVKPEICLIFLDWRKNGFRSWIGFCSGLFVGFFLCFVSAVFCRGVLKRLGGVSWLAGASNSLTPAAHLVHQSQPQYLFTLFAASTFYKCSKNSFISFLCLGACCWVLLNTTTKHNSFPLDTAILPNNSTTILLFFFT